MDTIGGQILGLNQQICLGLNTYNEPHQNIHVQTYGANVSLSLDTCVPGCVYEYHITGQIHQVTLKHLTQGSCVHAHSSLSLFAKHKLYQKRKVSVKKRRKYY